MENEFDRWDNRQDKEEGEEEEGPNSSFDRTLVA